MLSTRRFKRAMKLPNGTCLKEKMGEEKARNLKALQKESRI